MEIVIKGANATQKKHIESMVEFCVNKMMPRMRNLSFTIKLKDLTKANAYGFCCSDPEGDAERNDRPRAFEIEVHKGLRLRRLLQTVAHEMVHAKQYAKSELHQGVRIDKHRWKGKWVSNNLNYWDEPWEIEAHGREIGLFIQWAEANGLAKYKWTQEDE